VSTLWTATIVGIVEKRFQESTKSGRETGDGNASRSI
jgi:hypothetical protein